MNQALLRQLKRSIGITDEAALGAFLQSLKALSTRSAPEIQGLLSGFGDLIERVNASYNQYDRDLELRVRSLELSSQELTSVNAALREELNGREKALRSLRGAIHDLLPVEERSTEAPLEDNIEKLSKRIAVLVTKSEKHRHDLANQKFALDQHAIVSMTDTNGTITYANDRFCEISGYSRQELVGSNHRIIKSGIHPPEVFADMWGTITLGQVWHGEVCNRGKDGHLYWVSATIVPLLDANGEPEQYIGIRTEITDRKRMEAELHVQLELVEGLIESIPLPVYIKDSAGRYVRLNRAFELFFHGRREDFIGKTLYDLLLPVDARLHAEKDLELLQHGGVQTFEALVHDRDGIAHDTIYRKAALTRRDGTVYGLLGAIIDITDRKVAEVEMQKAKEVAEAASQAKSDFLANMSHEIRTPMNGIIGMTDLALETALTEEQPEFLSIVKASAEALLGIINDILDFSKIEAGKLLVENISFDLHRVLTEALKPLGMRAHEKRLELIFEISPEVPRHVIGDPSRLRQVLVNLVGNALKFTQKGEIALSVHLISGVRGKERIQFSVRDTGIGIAPDKQQAIFDAFAQEDTSTTRKFGGTGLGLSISRRLVELMKGDLWLESVVGQGSTFYFALDLPRDTKPVDSAPHRIDLRGREVLVIDDNATNRRVLAGMLAQWDIGAQTVDCGAAALDVIFSREKAFDCILLDAHMPEMDGYELAKRLLARPGFSTPMIMLSSGAVRGDAQRCQEVGISGYFSKPVSAEELLRAVCRVFEVIDQAGAIEAKDLVTRHALRERQHVLQVLLVEDHPVNQKLALSLLDKWGHRATLANNGQEAVDLVREHRFDVILMDMHMPVMGGLDATRQIRAEEVQAGKTRTPIVAMTAAAMQSYRDACMEAGMDDFLSKPIRSKDLLEVLKTYPASSNPPAKAAFDYGTALRNSYPEIVDIIANIFLETWQRDISRLRNALANTDAPDIERTAHSFKGTLGSFGAEPAQRVAARIESRAHQGDLTGMAPDIDSLAHELGLLELQLRARK